MNLSNLVTADEETCGQRERKSTSLSSLFSWKLIFFCGLSSFLSKVKNHTRVSSSDKLLFDGVREEKLTET